MRAPHPFGASDQTEVAAARNGATAAFIFNERQSMGTYTTQEYLDMFGGLPERGETYPDDPDILRDMEEQRDRDEDEERRNR